ncbi:2-(1,2-epoxy-1,2-dihydrophenyl)acetyl-CoA isomerase [Camelimonas fluminis]|uniref:Enoyl-CoA hydratase-related protein n=1 Tax=Camelimonas fluminis TaxID=1576911 RepID=A0ABV7ULI5_9HYPH|nr:enoyl-CoA hydratase-related protein [Camelimonas fluminis]GHE61043.1 2-(1,2-epoxy-1,2-dihydrophenyl)acetyl-CoA isomerase [Camelimonas fluminis]
MPAALLERRDGVAVITLNNPEQYNALSFEVMRDLDQATAEAFADAGVRAILLTGSGKGFCSGAQFGGEVFDTGAAIGGRMRQHLHPIIERLRGGRLPVVVAVNGPAAGAGVGLALAGDVVLAGRSARFILSFARLGAALDAGTSLFLQRSIGVARARALALTAEPLPAETAAEWGLIWRCVDDDALADEAWRLARHFAHGPAISIGLIKAQLEAAWDAPLPAALDHEADMQTLAFMSEDLKEGARAFVEKRAPAFKGR